MNQSKLFIHIGTWKTGSSTIQYNLHTVREKLEEEGFYYLCKENKMVARGWKIRNFTRVESEFVKKSREKFKNILERKRSKNASINFISSAEQFSGDPFLGFKNAGAVAENIYKITKDLGLDVYIIVYLRRQDDFFESLYQQSIRLGESHSFKEFLEKFDSSHFNWKNMIQAYAHIFGNDKIIVKRYHKKYLPKENSLMRDFGDAIGSKVIGNYRSTTSRNQGFSRDTLEIMKIMNRHFKGDERFELRKIFDRVNAKLPFEKYSFFSMEERISFLKKYEESNTIVAKKYFGEETLFPSPDYRLKKKEYDGLSTEAVVTSFSEALLIVKNEAEKENEKLAKKTKNSFFRHRLRKKIKKKLNLFPKLKRMFYALAGRQL